MSPLGCVEMVFLLQHYVIQGAPWLLQNAVVTLAWTVANYVLQGQIMGFKVDTWPHCLGPISNPPMIAVSIIIVIFAHVFVAANFLFTHRPLSLYRFPSKFRYDFWGVLLGAAGFFVVARAVKLMHSKREEQHQAVLRESGGSRQLASSRNSLGSGERVVPQAFSLRMRELSTKFQWLTFRAPRVAPLLPETSFTLSQPAPESRTAVPHPPAKPSPKASAQNSAELV